MSANNARDNDKSVGRGVFENLNDSDEQYLPIPLLGCVLDYLSLTDEYNWLLQSSSILLPSLREAREAIRSQRTCMLVCSETEAQYLSEPVYVLPSWKNMVALDLGIWATNTILTSVALRMPALERIDMVGSSEVSDLLVLSQLCKLRYIDVTFCNGISYDDTLKLRELLPQGETRVTVRRQPNWCDGRFETPFENDGHHTYWPDGTFQYERDNCSVGFVLSLQQIKENPFHIKVEIQPVNFEPPPAWPVWTKFLFRPAVSMLYQENRAARTDENPKYDRSVLVAQRLVGNSAPEDWPRPEHWSIPLGKSAYYSKRGHCLDDGNEDDAGERYIMVTRIGVKPLETVTTPIELLERNRQFLRLHDELKPTFLHPEFVLEHILNSHLARI